MRLYKIIILLIIILTFTYVNAFAFSIDKVFEGATNFLKDPDPDIDTKMSGFIKGLASAGLAIGTIVAICAGIVIAIQTMASGAYGKAQLKELLTPYIIGIVVLFAAWTVWAGVVNIMDNTFK